MKYDWESKAAKSPKVVRIGTAYWNTETGEGALILDKSAMPTSGIERADVLKDVMGDATAAYNAAIPGIWKE